MLHPCVKCGSEKPIHLIRAESYQGVLFATWFGSGLSRAYPFLEECFMYLPIVVCIFGPCRVTSVREMG